MSQDLTAEYLKLLKHTTQVEKNLLDAKVEITTLKLDIEKYKFAYHAAFTMKNETRENNLKLMRQLELKEEERLTLIDICLEATKAVEMEDARKLEGLHKLGDWTPLNVLREKLRACWLIREQT